MRIPGRKVASDMAQKRTGRPISSRKATMAAVDEPAKNRLYWRLMALPEITDAGSLRRLLLEALLGADDAGA